MTRQATARSAFTLVEVMISSALAAVVMAAVMSSYLFVGRNVARVSGYQALETQSRRALSYLARDLMLAQRLGAQPTASKLTLVTPAGEITYTYDSSSKSLRRQATFGANPDLELLRSRACECTEFTFRFFTSSGGAPTDQLTPTVFVPYSIKQIQVEYVVESPADGSAETRTRYQVASSRYVLRNRGLTNGT